MKQTQASFIAKSSSENTRLFNVFALLGVVYVLYVYAVRYFLEKFSINTHINFEVALHAGHFATVAWFILYVRKNFRRLWISAYKMRIQAFGNGIGAIVYGVAGVLFCGFGYIFLNFIAPSPDFAKFSTHSASVGLRDIGFPYLFLLGMCFMLMRLMFKLCTYQRHIRRRAVAVTEQDS